MHLLQSALAGLYREIHWVGTGNGWTEGVHPEDFKTCLETYIKAFDRREKFSMEYRLRRYDGEYRWILDNGVPRLNEDGSFAGYIGSCTDVTERRVATGALIERLARRVWNTSWPSSQSPQPPCEALQHSLDATCETLAFPVGHALVIYDDEPELANSLICTART